MTNNHSHSCKVPKSPGNRGERTVSAGSQHSGAGDLFVVKMPKAGGASFILELLAWSCTYPFTQHFRWSESGQASAGRLGLILREPLSHTLSMYNHCQYGQGYLRHHYKRISLRAWVQEWRPNATRRFCRYHPLNFQTTRLAGMLAGKQARMREAPAETQHLKLNLALALEAVRTASFVGVTHLMKESLCVAVYNLYGTLPADGRCLCDLSPVQLRRETHGVNHSEVDEHNVSAGTFELIRKATRADQILYAHALARLYSDVRTIERALQVQIICDLSEEEGLARQRGTG